MKNLVTVCFICAIFLIKSSYCKAQDNKAKVLEADSLISGNAKDVLTSFFQLAFNKLTGTGKELNFNSNPFAIMLKSNPRLATDTNYCKYKTLRKVNFGFGLKLDSSYRFNGFSSGIKYALINRRDTTTSVLLFTRLDENVLGEERKILNTELGIYQDNHFANDPAGKIAFINNINDLFNKHSSFKTLDTAFQRIVKEIVAGKKLTNIQAIVEHTPNSNIAEASSKIFDSLKSTIKNALLWTIGISDTTYKNQFFFSNIVMNTELSKGLGKNKPGSNWEFNIKAYMNLFDDTLTQRRDLKRCTFNIEPGFNWVIRTKDNDHSFLELKFSGSYLHNFSSLYASEKRDIFMMNSIIRVRIIDNIWVPLEIKYNPGNGNFFGFLNVRINFTGIGKTLNPKK